MSILDSQGKPPAGHQGKKDKALAAWKANKAKKTGAPAKPKVNALGVQQDEPETGYEQYYEYEEEDDDGDEIPERMFSFIGQGPTPAEISLTPQSYAHPNRYAEIRNDVENDDSESESGGDHPNHPAVDPETPIDLDFLHAFAHQVHRGRKISQKKAAQKMKNKPITIDDVKDLDKPHVKQIINALPRNQKGLDKLAKRCPTEEMEPLEEGEIYVMGDTGSTLNGIDVEKELPHLFELVRPLGKKIPGAECANGGMIDIHGEIDLAGHIDDHFHAIKFNHMKVSMPIASMRQAIDKGSVLRIAKGGGTLKNMRTGHVIKLHERMGVYFFKMKLLDLEGQKKYQRPSASLFTRPA